ncbi:uncharacterized protein LOC126368964 [Pectinophora gossypiella]|uniref:uncharacterized protein LOC126368964 n=1 Tax=Pectinophora gossypiella TaxID=13191 RepID=UPI00214F1531|nr:uncharacterized protein LOC126368964 [Pectinophora gossypiella]
MKMWSKLVLLCVFGCTNSLTTSFDLGGVVSGNRMAAVPLGHSLGDGELDVEGICTQPGMACQDCTTAVTCVPLPIGWLKVPVHICPEGLTCNAHEGKCSNNTVPECDVTNSEYQHTCEQVGIFPDAFDCRKFHLCSPPQGLPDGRPADHRTALCPRHYGYNPQTAQCSIRLTHGQCIEKPVPTCSIVGQTDVLPKSPNHYYVCLLKHGSLYPQIFICPHGWYFWGGFCRPEPKDEQTTENEKDSAVFKVPTTTEATTTKIESFFSTERATTYAADSFLADKFDLTNYETIDDQAPSFDDFTNSFESDWS